MRHGVVLAFPSPRGLRDDDRDVLQRFTASLPGARADILVSRDRRAVAFLSLAGRHVWITRDADGLVARDAESGRPLARETCLARLLATVRTTLLSGPAMACAEVSAMPHATQTDRPDDGL